MKIYYLLFVIFLSIGFACNDELNNELNNELDLANTCSVENPLEDLDWLVSEIQILQNHPEFSKYYYVTQAEYENRTVFIFGNCCPYCFSVITVRNCLGEDIGNLGNSEGDIDFSILENDKIIWKADDSLCEL